LSSTARTSSSFVTIDPFDNPRPGKPERADRIDSMMGGEYSHRRARANARLAPEADIHATGTTKPFWR
jgi:hypothetical protein